MFACPCLVPSCLPSFSENIEKKEQSKEKNVKLMKTKILIMHHVMQIILLPPRFCDERPHGAFRHYVIAHE